MTGEVDSEYVLVIGVATVSSFQVKNTKYLYSFRHVVGECLI